MSLPYHIGNGWFGGMLPLAATALVVWPGDIYYGLWYPIWVSVMTFVIGILFVREGRQDPRRALRRTGGGLNGPRRDFPQQGLRRRSRRSELVCR